MLMKTKLLSALALCAAAGAAQAAFPPTSLEFTGYCDGLTSIYQGANGVATATHDYTNCFGYTNTPMAGTNGKRMTNSAAQKGIALTDASYPQFGAHLQYVIRNDYTWSLISAESGAIVNYGTWTAGYPLQGDKGGKPSSAF